MTGPRSGRRWGPFFFFFFCLSAQHPQSDRVIRGVQYCNRVCIWMFLVRYMYMMTGCIFRAPSALWQGQVLTPQRHPPIHLKSRVPPPPGAIGYGCYALLLSLTFIKQFLSCLNVTKKLSSFCHEVSGLSVSGISVRKREVSNIQLLILLSKMKPTQ